MKRFPRVALIAMLAASLGTSASAALIQWDVNGTFGSGATVSGTVVWNTATQLFDRWSILVGGDAAFTAATYSNTVPSSSQFVSAGNLDFSGSTAGFGAFGFFEFQDNLLTELQNAQSSISFDMLDECRPNCGTRRRGTGGSFTNATDVTPGPFTPVQLPGSLPLVACALAALVAVMRLRKQAA